MKSILQLFTGCLFSIASLAHPGIGIVKDSKGNIYYTDLKQVCKITPAGVKSVVVKNVHTHELYMDANDDLYGEHVWYNGEQLNTWGHYVWCLRASGQLDTVINPTAGFLENYSFVRDSSGNMYWVERFKVSRFKKKTREGVITTVAEGKFKDIRWMYASAGGDIYFIDLVDLYKIDSGGHVILIGKDLASHTAGFGISGDDRHSIFGIWTDNNENIYLANYSGQVVKRVISTGPVEDVVHSIAPWSPVGGIFDNEGNMWLMENSIVNDVRVRKIKKDEIGKNYTAKAYVTNNVLPVSVVIGILTLFGLLIKKLVVKGR